MRRFAISALVAASLAVALALPAAAVTNGTPDGNRHPYVGLIVFDDANGPAWRCTGALLSPTVVLTAGHCTERRSRRSGLVRRGRLDEHRVPVQWRDLL